MKKIDAHFHINLGRFDLKAILNYMDSQKVDQMWLLSWEEIPAPIPQLYKHLPIEDLFEAFEKHKDRFVPFYAPDPNSENIKERLTEYKQKGLRGCGELKSCHKWGDEKIENYLSIIEELELPLIFHMELPRDQFVKKGKGKAENLIGDLMNGALNGQTRYYLKNVFLKTPGLGSYVKKHLQFFPGYVYDFENLEKRIQQFPKLKFIGHGPHFWNNVSNKISEKYVHQKGKIEHFGIIDHLLESYDNFYCDISGRSGYNAISRDPEAMKRFTEKHQDKMLFGTDNVREDFDALVATMKLSNTVLEKLYYKNAEKVLS